MIPGTKEILSSLYGAWRLVLRDADGMRWLALTVPGFWNSFFGIVLVLPMVLLVASLPTRGEDVAMPSVALLIVETITAWSIRPLILLGLCTLLSRTQRFAALMIAWNWVSVLQTAMFATAAVVAVVAPGMSGLLFLVVLAAMLAIDYFVARTALDVPGGAAVAVVIVMLLASLLLELVVFSGGA
jgi:hypothetical protein